MRRALLATLVAVSSMACGGNDRAPAPGSDDTDTTDFDSSDIDTGSGGEDTGTPDGSTPDGSTPDGAEASADGSSDGSADGAADGAKSDADATFPPDAIEFEVIQEDDTGPDDAAVDTAPAVDTGPKPICDPTATIGSVTALAPASTASPDELGAVTPDGLTIAWTSVPASGDVKIFFSDRSDTSSAFGTATEVPAPAEGFAHKGVGLSPDGKRLIYVTKLAKTIHQLTRTTRSGAFGTTVESAPFLALELLAGDGPVTLGYPVIGADDKVIYFVLDEPTVRTVRRGTRSSSSAAWSGGVPLTVSPLVNMAPTGISTDDLTLFVWKQSTSKAYAITRINTLASFSITADLGTRKYVAPSADCKTLYYSATPLGGLGGLDLVSEK